MRMRFREIHEIKEVKPDDNQVYVSDPEAKAKADAIFDQILDMFAEGTLSDPKSENPTPIERADAIFDKCLDALES